MEGKDQGPSPLRELVAFLPQADRVLVDLFFIRGRPGGFVKAPRHLRGRAGLWSQVFLSLKWMPLPIHLSTSCEWFQTSVFGVRRIHILEIKLNWPCFSRSISSPLLRLGSSEASVLKPGKVLTKDSKREKILFSLKEQRWSHLPDRYCPGSRSSHCPLQRHLFRGMYWAQSRHGLWFSPLLPASLSHP